MDIDRRYHTEFMENSRISLGQYLRWAMESRGMTTVQLAAKVGMLPVVLEKYLNGDESLSIGMYDLLLAILDYRIVLCDIESGRPLEIPEDEV